MSDLDELEQLEKAASPGPWAVKTSGEPSDFTHSWVESAEEFYDDNGNDGHRVFGHRRANAEFAVAARNALPALLQRLRTAEAIVRDLAACAPLQEYEGGGVDCVLCGVEHPTANGHAESCPYRRAVEAQR